MKKAEVKQIMNAEELIGKKIERTAYIDNAFFLFFIDKTFCVFRGSGWEDRDVELMDEKYNTQPNGYNTMDLLHLGFMNKEEANQRIEKDKEENLKLKEKIEIAKLKELQSKYPNS